MELISLKALCARRICFLNNFDRLITLIPTNLGKQIKSLYYSISQTKKLYEAFRNLPEKYFVINSHAFEVDRFLSVLSTEKLLTKSQYFTLCAIHAMDEETSRVFASMTDDDKHELGDENAVVNVRIGELSRIPTIHLYYKKAALVAARNGWLEAFHKYLSKEEQHETELKRMTVDHLQKLLFTTSKPDDKLHRCVVVFDKKYAVSSQHGDHSSFKKDDKLVLYNVMDSNLEIEVAVSVVRNDFVIFKSIDRDFPYYSDDYEMFVGQKYLQMGVDQKTRNPAWREGIIPNFHFGIHLGTSHGEFEDSGAGIFNEHGRFIGISVAKKNFYFSNLHTSGPKIEMDYGGVADHLPETKIISTIVIHAFLDKDPDPDFLPREITYVPDETFSET